MIERSAFVAMTEEAFAAIPAEFLAQIDNLTLIVEDWASDEVLTEFNDADPLDLLGDYRGCPLPARSQGDVGGLPDLIVLYQGAIEAYAEDYGEPLEQVIRETLLHEVAHYFGFSENEMDAIEALWQQGNESADLDI